MHLDTEHLVQLDGVSLEPELGAGHVHGPDPRAARTDLGDRLVPVLREVRAPSGESLRVVLAKVLLVPHLEAVVLHRRDDRADTFELPVREDVAVDEAADAMVLGVGRAGDAVVEQAGTGARPRGEEGEVRRQVVLADVLGQSDRRDGVEVPFGYVAVVAEPDLGQVAEAFGRYGLLRPLRLPP